MLLGLLGLLGSGFVGCRPASAPEPMTIGPVMSPPAPGTDAQERPVSILSAHLAVKDAPVLEGKDALPVVFSAHVDPASLQADAFVVAFADGNRVIPDEAMLAPANEADENRTVLLVGEFANEQDEQAEPTDVVVIGKLFTEDGDELEGLSADVLPFDTAGRVVLAEHLLPHSDDVGAVCPDASQVVRTYWIDGLREVQAEDAAKIEIVLDDERVVRPIGFDDHDLDDQTAQDNVLDLCVGESSRARRVKMPAGLFTDPSGHETAAVDVAVVDGAAPVEPE